MPEETVILKNRLSELSKLQTFVDSFGGKYALSEETIRNANLAMEEAVVNIISYAHKTRNEEHEIIIRLKMEGYELVFNIEDDGIPFNPLDFPEPDPDRPVEDKAGGGLGIYLIRSLAKSASYTRKQGKNLLSITMEINRDG